VKNSIVVMKINNGNSMNEENRPAVGKFGWARGGI
jgi:hypothetical protein